MTSGVAAKAGGGSGRVGVADAFHHSVHKITPTGTVSTLAGTGSAGAADDFVKAAVSFRKPFRIAINAGSTWVPDTVKGTLRRVAAEASRGQRDNAVARRPRRQPEPCR